MPVLHAAYMKKGNVMELAELRKEIDEIDSQIIDLFERRMKVCSKVAEYKIENNMPVLDKTREDEKLERLKTMMSDEMREYGASLYSCLFELSRDYQKKIIERM